MKTFEEALEEKLEEIPYTPHLDDGEYNEGVYDGFESGAEWASKSPELIDEILTKYHEWALSLPGITFVKWDYEEVYPDKTKARMRKEFIEYLENQNNPH